MKKQEAQGRGGIIEVKSSGGRLNTLTLAIEPKGGSNIDPNTRAPLREERLPAIP